MSIRSEGVGVVDTFVSNYIANVVPDANPDDLKPKQPKEKSRRKVPDIEDIERAARTAEKVYDSLQK